MQRGGGSSVFEPLVRGGSFNFQIPMGGGSSYFMTGIDTPVCQPAGEISHGTHLHGTLQPLPQTIHRRNKTTT